MDAPVQHGQPRSDQRPELMQELHILEQRLNELDARTAALARDLRGSRSWVAVALLRAAGGNLSRRMATLLGRRPSGRIAVAQRRKPRR